MEFRAIKTAIDKRLHFVASLHCSLEMSDTICFVEKKFETIERSDESESMSSDIARVIPASNISALNHEKVHTLPLWHSMTKLELSRCDAVRVPVPTETDSYFFSPQWMIIDHQAGRALENQLRSEKLKKWKNLKTTCAHHVKSCNLPAEKQVETNEIKVLSQCNSMLPMEMMHPLSCILELTLTALNETASWSRNREIHFCLF